MKAYIVLRCDGRDVDGFKFCSGVSNLIVDLEEIQRTENYMQLIQYLNGVPRIFDSPCFKPSVISNAIYKIYDLGYISDKKYKYIAHFYEMHKRCGLILECFPKDIEE